MRKPDLFTKEEIEKHLSAKRLAGSVFFYDTTGSTNTDCKAYMEQEVSGSVLVAAANQNAGKGRRGRSWSSPENTSVSFSLGLIPPFDPDKASMLTLVMALAVSRALEELTGLKAGIKWPNDIVLDGKKVCGILTEMHLRDQKEPFVVIGVGINVSQTEFEPEIRQVATSLLSELQRHTKNADDACPGRAKLTAACVNHFETAYESFLTTCDLSALKEDYEGRMINKGREVRVLDPAGAYNGIAKGITDEGLLLVRGQNNELTSVYAGEVSVRGVLGYV
ncbi:MAG: biotin--[acetyl-CoA-carboxylase] ligase [Lachnospiraceae bacterium]|nr:biotin--[acetyl-CoA-carboxylase] ligase [Lachnospiraceae bacterium]